MRACPIFCVHFTENVRLADAPTVPLYFVNQNWLVKPNVTGFGYSPLYMHPWRQVTIR